MFPQGLVVVTGASSGIGEVYAEKAASLGNDLLLVARRAERLLAVAERLTERHGVNVETLVADLTNCSDLAALESRLANAPVAALINNAGAGGLGVTAQSTADAQEATIRLDVIAPVRLSLAALEGFRVAGAGVLVNIASVSAFAASMKGATYSGSKAFVLNFTHSLQLEYADTAIRIQAVLPGPIRTEFFTSQGLDDSYFPASAYISAEQLVDAAMAGLAAGEQVTIPTMLTAELYDQSEAARREILKEVMKGAVGERYSS